MDSKKLIALTFDDGPSNITGQVLDILEEHGAIGTFFLIGNLVTEDKKEILKRQAAMGCEIANHSFTHSDMSGMTAGEIRNETDMTSDVIRKMAGVEPKFFRPPYISLSDTMYDNIHLPFICGVDSKDWDPSTSAEDRINNVLSNVSDGSLVLMHDMADNQKTLEALPVIIEKLKEQGYSFATVSEIFKAKNISPAVPHKIWSNVFD